MGDTDAQPTETQNDQNNADLEISKPSIDILKESKPNENIAINEVNSSPESSSENVKPENENLTVSSTDDTKLSTDDKQKDKVSLKNKSDIFSLNENKNISNTIFSVGGAPAKTIHQTATPSTDTIGSNSTKLNQLRNPVTGIGVSSNDEFKNKPPKRRDGNPLLGIGYKDDVVNPHGNQRIPPGGHSNGLW